jgi:hypothetical protein
MHPDAHLYIHRAEQAMRARTHQHHGGRTVRRAAVPRRWLRGRRQDRTDTTAGALPRILQTPIRSPDRRSTWRRA